METTFMVLDNAFKAIVKEINEQTKEACFYISYIYDGTYTFAFSPTKNGVGHFTAYADKDGVIVMNNKVYNEPAMMKEEILNVLNNNH